MHGDSACDEGSHRDHRRAANEHKVVQACAAKANFKVGRELKLKQAGLK
jgi:hypothetical protein